MSILYFIFVLGLIVFVHELGHLIVAKAFNVYCKEFSLGFGPVVWSKQKEETQYSIRAIPLGGFVAMAGETDQGIDESIPFDRTIKGIHPFKRILVMLAGIAFNFIPIYCFYSHYFPLFRNYISSMISMVRIFNFCLFSYFYRVFYIFK